MNDSKKGGGIVMLVVVLGLITLICALLLGVVNQITAPKIEANQKATLDAAMAEIIPDAKFEAVDVSDDYKNPADKNAAAITQAFKATKDGQDAGYCVEVMPKGFGGALTLIVGINSDGTVAGAKVTAHAETPGLGAKAQQDPSWMAQFAGKAADGSLAVTKDGGEINAITGATITSRAVTKGVNTAAQFVATLG
ncbi:MAG: RnfABCDGE type electron transport complex subunit G [Clostridia bacterium]|nr:RnfABCDGE type electron transport complex subunit G [Clostridia bacterium]